MKEAIFRYSHIHCRSRYSLLRGVLSFDEICQGAAAAGERIVGLTDINNMYGLPEFLYTSSAFGLKAACGAVITAPGEGGEESYLFTAYCLNREGFYRLNTIITKRNHGGGCYDPVLDLVEDGWAGLLIISNNTSVLKQLRSRGEGRLYAGLFYGLPYAGLRKFAYDYDIPAAAFNEAVILRPENFKALKLLRAVDLRIPAARIKSMTEPASPPAAAQMNSFFSGVPEALVNTAEIAEMAASAGILPGGWVFPSYEGFSEDEAAAELYSLCRQGISRRYGTPGPGRTGPGPRARAEQRLKYELDIITRKGFASYFMVVRDIVRQAPRTCGRGSAASSIVSYLLGITHVDPLAYNLFFERFLNMERQDPPDIDIDFPWDERAGALNYVFKKYPGSSGMVADHVCFKRRGAAREAAKALGMTSAQTDEIMKKWKGGRGEPLPAAVADAAALLYGRPRYIGTHPGGVIITPGPIAAYTHTQPSASGVPVIAWEKDGAEQCGLIKIDLLGNRSLAVLRDTMKLVNPRRSSKLSWESFQPYSDMRTRRYIESGDTAGIFYIESPATRQLLRKMGCADFEHVVAASSIIRPAANKWINEYVRRLKGGEYSLLSPLLEGVLDETYGIMVYQEDVARVAIAFAGFSPGEADQLRKTLSKKNRAEKLARWKERFMAGAARRGAAAAEAEVLWQEILSFDGYSFCKSHSASYALVSYRLAWLKLRYPLEFMVSVINNDGGFYSRQVYLNMVRRMGFPVLKPDINKSGALYSIEEPQPGIRALRAGLLQVKNLSAGLISSILKRRGEGGGFRTYEEFLEGVAPSYRDVRQLIKSGCLDSIGGGLNRPQLFWRYYHRGAGLCEDEGFFDTRSIPELPPYSRAVSIGDEIATLELFFTSHPAELFLKRAAGNTRKNFIDSRALSLNRGRTVSIVGTLAAEKDVLTAKKREMSFLSFEDSYSIFEAILFPDAWALFEAVISRGFAFLVTGVVEFDMGAEYINVSKIECLNRIRTVS